MDLSRSSVSSNASSTSSPKKPAVGLHTELLIGRAGELISSLDAIESLLGKDFKLEFPQIVIIGDEYAGKSALVERLAMLQFFPKRYQKNTMLCTRMPIRLKLQHMSKTAFKDFCKQHNLICGENGACVRLKYEGSDGTEAWSEFYGLEEVEQQVNKHMNRAVALKNGELKGVIEDVMTIEVTSPFVANLTVIDLPGIVAARQLGEPDNMMDLTRNLVEKYLTQEHTLILAVVSAASRVRAAQALQLIQKHKKELQTMLVITMPDQVTDIADVKGKLDGTSDDYIPIPHGYITVKNHDARKGERLVDSAQTENDWFDAHMPGYREKEKASGEVLVKKLVKLMIKFIEDWIPTAVTKVEGLISKVEKDLLNLGADPETLVNSFDEVLKECKELYAPLFSKLKDHQMVTAIYNNVTNVIKDSLKPTYSSSSKLGAAYQWMGKKDEILKAATQALDCSSIIRSHFSSALLQKSKYRLERFQFLQMQMLHCVSSLCDKYKEKATSRVKQDLNTWFIFRDPDNNASSVQAVINIVWTAICEEIIFPLERVLDFTWEVKKLLIEKHPVSSLLEEAAPFRINRQTYKAQLTNLKSALKSIKELRNN